MLKVTAGFGILCAILGYALWLSHVRSGELSDEVRGLQEAARIYAQQAAQEQEKRLKHRKAADRRIATLNHDLEDLRNAPYSACSDVALPDELASVLRKRQPTSVQ